jgi:hypothetical protein
MEYIAFCASEPSENLIFESIFHGERLVSGKNDETHGFLCPAAPSDLLRDGPASSSQSTDGSPGATGSNQGGHDGNVCFLCFRPSFVGI